MAERDHAPARPLVHFTPPSGWMNDPNGLVHADGVWHLCYQHHPDGLGWGPMHWGHATSRDLLAWEHRPIAIRPDRLGTAFSGSAVVDHEGVAGLGRGALLAFFTHFVEEVPQSQGVAYSTDGGETWQAYPGNPVLPAVEDRLDCRDPKVLRVGEGAQAHWVMVLAAGDEVLFHRSEDLLRWEPTGRFGSGHGSHDGVWETPDLFEIAVEGTRTRRWVLTVSVLSGGPAGGAGTQYFVGDFRDGTFVPEPPAAVRWVDLGADFYAPQSWSDAPDGRRVWLAWMSNWAYGRVTPATIWRGTMTLPRDVVLLTDTTGPVLAQRPVRELAGRGRPVLDTSSLPPGPGPHELGAWPAYDLGLRLDAEGAGRLSLDLHSGAGTPTRVHYDLGRRTLTVVPSPDGLPDDSRRAVQEAVVGPHEGYVDLRVVVDTCSVEVFAGGGRTVLTNQVFPAPGATGLVLARQGAVRVSELTVHALSVAAP